jgi:hypothetical protein
LLAHIFSQALEIPGMDSPDENLPPPVSCKDLPGPSNDRFNGDSIIFASLIANDMRQADV